MAVLPIGMGSQDLMCYTANGNRGLGRSIEIYFFSQLPDD
jgi:hypothetical protein